MNIFLDLIFWALTFDVLGKILLGFSVILVHSKIVEEHRVDKIVLTEMRKERSLALFGIFLMLVGYALELIVIYELF
ncbi:hypothetical protein ACFL6I_16480 [candidate division KSB1 bacterium]